MKFILKYGQLIVFFLILLLFFIGIFNTYFKKEEIYDAKYFNIEEIKSSIDYDNDGIDDYTDIFEGAKKFIDQKPKYKSKYYEGGYPTDEYSVCTDLFWYALKEAGYDFKTLIDNDIKENQQDYDIINIDSNIDFRRVKNIKVFLDKYSEKVTIDPTVISNWQRGDIVIYANHIAIISDKRNKLGQPYIIHHSGNYNYEEDALTVQNIIGHYRFNLSNIVN